MKLGFFGGAFNPPTIAHYNLVKQALNEYDFDKIYFVPINNFYKKENLISIDDRINMLEILCKNDEKMAVSKIEKENLKPLKAIDVFKLIEEKFANDEIAFLMGEDNFRKMPTWKDYEHLKKYNYIVFERDNKEKVKQENVIYINNIESLNISSTIIRNKLQINESINEFVTKDVEEYIIKNNLYTNCSM